MPTFTVMKLLLDHLHAYCKWFANPEGIQFRSQEHMMKLQINSIVSLYRRQNCLIHKYLNSYYFRLPTTQLLTNNRTWEILKLRSHTSIYLPRSILTFNETHTRIQMKRVRNLSSSIILTYSLSCLQILLRKGWPRY